MKRKRLKSVRYKKRPTAEQLEQRRKDRAAAMEARSALGFDKMKISGLKIRKLDSANPCGEILLPNSGQIMQGFIGFSQTVNYTQAQLQQIYTQTHLNP